MKLEYILVPESFDFNVIAECVDGTQTQIFGAEEGKILSPMNPEGFLKEILEIARSGAGLVDTFRTHYEGGLETWGERVLLPFETTKLLVRVPKVRIKGVKSFRWGMCITCHLHGEIWEIPVTQKEPGVRKFECGEPTLIKKIPYIIDTWWGEKPADWECEINPRILMECLLPDSLRVKQIAY